MTPRSPGSYRRAAIAVIVIAVLIGSGIDLVIARTLTNAPSTSTICTIPDDGALLVKVLNSSNGQPLGSIPVQVESYYPNCIPALHQTGDTNSSGMVLFAGTADDYNLTVVYANQKFSASTHVSPGSLTCVEFAIPSGEVNITQSQGGGFDCASSLTSSTTTTSEDCVTTPGQSQGAYLRVLNDSSLAPMRGLGVTATLSVPYGCTSVPISFTTNGTEWYSLPTTDAGTYAITVSYLRHDYNFTMSLGPSVWTCQTLYLPSGNIVGVTSPEGPCDLSNASGTTTTETANASSTSTPGNCPSDTTCASFTYSPTGQVQVVSVQTTQFVCQNCGAVNGQSYLSFQVGIVNVGNSPIYIAGGSDELSVLVPANSSVVPVPSERCAGTFTVIELGQGENYTLYGPPCDDAQEYQVVQAGSVNMTFSFDWTTNPAATTYPDTTTTSANFTFA